MSPLAPAAVLGAALGAGAAAPAAAWLRAGGHRRPGDSTRRRPTGWVVPLAGLVGGALAVIWRERPALAVVLVVVAALLVALAAADLDVRRLPDVLTRPAALVAGLGLGLTALVEGDLGAWVRALIAGLVLFAGYLLLVLAAPSGMGFGDAKLAPTLGMVLGYLSWGHVVLGTMLAFVSGAVVALVLLAGGAGRSARLAFGPHMVIGTLLVLAAGPLTKV